MISYFRHNCTKLNKINIHLDQNLPLKKQSSLSLFWVNGRMKMWESKFDSFVFSSNVFFVFFYWTLWLSDEEGSLRLWSLTYLHDFIQKKNIEHFPKKNRQTQELQCKRCIWQLVERDNLTRKKQKTKTQWPLLVCYAWKSIYVVLQISVHLYFLIDSHYFWIVKCVHILFVNQFQLLN